MVLRAIVTKKLEARSGIGGRSDVGGISSCGEKRGEGEHIKREGEVDELAVVRGVYKRQ